MTRRLAFCLVTAALAAACASPVGPSFNGEELSARTLPAARVVHFAVISGQLSDDLQGAALLQRAVAVDPSIMMGLRGYRVTARRDGAASAVLVCDAQGKRALVEDAGCTQKVDAEYWRDGASAPCEFAVSLANLCR